jgi:hypothetical protein
MSGSIPGLGRGRGRGRGWGDFIPIGAPTWGPELSEERGGGRPRYLALLVGPPLQLLPSCSIDSAAGAAVGLGEVFRRG